MAFSISLHSTDPLLMKAEHGNQGTAWVTLEMRDDKSMARNDYQWTAGNVTIFMDDDELARRLAKAINDTISDYRAELASLLQAAE